MNDDDATVHEHDVDDDHDAYHKYHGYDCRGEQTIVQHALAVFQPELLCRCREPVDLCIRSSTTLSLIGPNIH